MSKSNRRNACLGSGLFAAILLALIMGMTSSCATRITEKELRSVAGQRSGDTLGMVYYQGRKKGYDYFKVRGNVGSKTYCVSVPNGIVETAIPYSSEPNKWDACAPGFLRFPPPDPRSIWLLEGVSD